MDVPSLGDSGAFSLDVGHGEAGGWTLMSASGVFLPPFPECGPRWLLSELIQDSFPFLWLGVGSASSLAAPAPPVPLPGSLPELGAKDEGDFLRLLVFLRLRLSGFSFSPLLVGTHHLLIGCSFAIFFFFF